MPSSALPSSMALFPVAPLSALITSGRTEAEDLSIGSGFGVRKNPHPSGGEYLQATAASSVAGGTFTGATGTYDLTLGYFDETDGVSHLEIVVNGTIVGSFNWDSLSGDATVTKASKAEFRLPGITLTAGDTIELRGTMDGGEPLRIDYLDLATGEGAPASESFMVEAEDLDIGQGFEVVRNGAASGGLNLQHTHGALASASYTVDKAGTFDVTIGYFDETDGASAMRVLLNGVEIADWTWDSDAGAAIASKASRTEKVLGNLALGEGDVITLEGNGDGGEPLRLDFLKFDAVDATDPEPSPSLDFWFLRDGQVVLALNDGDGCFSEKNTGIDEGDSRVHAADFDGDGDVDFFTWKILADPFPLPAWNSDPATYEFEIQTIVYLNDGSGNFTSATLEAQTITHALDPFWVDVYSDYTENLSYPRMIASDDRRELLLRNLIDIQDAADYDGDGDIDLVGVAKAAGGFFILENDGDGTFEMLPPAFPGISEDWVVNRPYTIDFLDDLRNVVHFADFNGDENLDLLFSSAGSISYSYILLNDGAGNFDFLEAHSANDGNVLEQIVDIDADGDMDVFSNTEGEGGGIGIFVNGGRGVSEERYTPSGHRINHDHWPSGRDSLYNVGPSAVANFDDDPWVEIVNASIENSNLGAGLRVIDLSREGDDFLFEVQSLDETITGDIVGNGDFDGDGDLDVILGVRDLSGGYPGTSDLYLLLNDGNASFSMSGLLIEGVDNWHEYQPYYSNSGAYAFGSIRTAYMDDAVVFG